jgi:hypothetical protein
MIVTIAKVADSDQFLKTLRRRALRRGSSTGPRAPTSSAIPDDPSRVWVFFDWQIADYGGSSPIPTSRRSRGNSPSESRQ